MAKIVISNALRIVKIIRCFYIEAWYKDVYTYKKLPMQLTRISSYIKHYGAHYLSKYENAYILITENKAFSIIIVPF